MTSPSQYSSPISNHEILCTLGPSSMNEKTIHRLDEIGVNLFRINLSHTAIKDLEERIRFIQKITDVPICLDSEGAQVRTGDFGIPKFFVKENALLKATHAAYALSRWTLADDSGLVVPALQGAPGIHSRRFAGEKATDKENRQKLLNLMRALTPPDRDAYFECWVALAAPDGSVKTGHGLVEGEILETEKGSHGFGYDSLFLKHEYGKTFAQLDEQTKNRISHRRKALERIRCTLETLPTPVCT